MTVRFVFDSMSNYARDVARTTRLTRQEEQELAELIVAGRQAAAQVAEHGSSPRLRRTIRRGQEAEGQFVVANLRLVLKIVNKLQGRVSMDKEDLVQEGNLGLIHAVEKFDWSRGIRFSTYASFWIQKYLDQAMQKQSRLIYIPQNVDEVIRKINRARDQLAVSLGRPATGAEVAAKLKMTVEEVVEHDIFNTPPASLSTTTEEEIDVAVYDDDPDCDPADCKLVRSIVSNLLDATVTDRERPALEMLYGLGDSPEMNRAETAEALGTSASTVARLQRSALSKLREAA